MNVPARRSKNTASGFAVTELVLIVVAIAIIGFVGWFVYHARQVSDKTLSSTSSGSPTFAVRPKTTATPATGSTSSDSDQSLQSSLNSASASNNQASQDMNSTNSSLNDQSTFTTVPQ